jgi:VWFA-related protein
MRGMLGFAVLLFGAPAGPVGAQAPAQSQPEIASHDEPVTFSSRVNLVSVPVVVRDHDGKAIGAFQRDDFQLLDKGKLQAITKFSIEKSGKAALEAEPANAPGEKTEAPTPAPPVLPDSYVAYLVDDVHLKPGDLLQTRLAMNRHLDEALDRASRAAIFTTSGTMLSDFTDDREQLHKAVEKVQPWSRGKSADDCPNVSYYLADLLMNKFLYFSGQSDVQIAALVLDGTGDKALIGVVKEAEQCSHLALNPPPPQPPPHNPPIIPIPPPEPLIIAVRQAVRESIIFGERETSLGLTALKDAIRRLSVMPGSRNLVLVSPGFLLTLENRPEETDVLERAIRANVAINAIDMRGVFTNAPGGDPSQRGYVTPEAATYLGQYDAAAVTQAADVLAEVAEGTGGTFFHNDNDLKKGLNLLASRPEYVYVLGFSPQDLKFDGAYHALKVTVRNSANLTIQARRGYWAPKFAVDAAQGAKQELQETFFSQEEIPGIPLDLQTSFFQSGDAKFELSVTARLGLTGLRFKKADGRNNDTVTVLAGLFDNNGKNVAAIKRVLDLRLRDQSLATLQAAGIRMKENFSVAPGRYQVRVVVTDSEGQSITARNGSVQIP